MVEVRTCQYYLSCSNDCESDTAFDFYPLAAPGSPAVVFGIPPAPITEMGDPAQVRPTALLTPSAGPPKPHAGRELFPVDGIKPAVLRTDRHDDSMSQVGPEQKRKVQLCVGICASDALDLDGRDRF